jgi:hypothetical protein
MPHEVGTDVPVEPDEEGEAEAIGVDEGTIRHDIRPAENSAAEREDLAPSEARVEQAAEFSAPELEYLLTDDRWRQIGGGYQDVNVFLRPVDFSAFNLQEKRPELVRRIKDLQH